MILPTMIESRPRVVFIPTQHLDSPVLHSLPIEKQHELIFVSHLLHWFAYFNLRVSVEVMREGMRDLIVSSILHFYCVDVLFDHRFFDSLEHSRFIHVVPCVEIGS